MRSTEIETIFRQSVIIPNATLITDPVINWMHLDKSCRLDLPVGGGPDTLRAIQSFELEGDGTYTANSGDCYVMFVEWDSRGRLRSESIHQFGSATLDQSSPHYADQAPLFAQPRLRTVWMDEADIRAHLQREYRPGE